MSDGININRLSTTTSLSLSSGMHSGYSRQGASASNRSCASALHGGSLEGIRRELEGSVGSLGMSLKT